MAKRVGGSPDALVGLNTSLSALFQALIVDLCEGKILQAVGPPAQGAGLRVGSLAWVVLGRAPFPSVPATTFGGQTHLSVTHPGGMSHEGMSLTTAAALS